MRHGLVWMRTLAAEVEMTYWLELEVSRVRPLTPLANVKPVGFGTAWTRTESAVGNEMPTFGEKLVSLAKWEQHLKPGITAPMLQRQAMHRSDTEAAQQMQKAKLALLAKSRGPK